MNFGSGASVMRICWRVAAVALTYFSIALTSLFADEVERPITELDMFASMAGKCTTLRVAERDFSCTAVAFSHSPGGRSGFIVPLNDPDDDSNVITFSGEKAKREQDNRYELSIDQMLLKSRHRHEGKGFWIPSVEPATGMCKQIGNFATQRVSSVSCIATDATGRKYEFEFESDGSPIKVLKIRVADLADPAVEERRAKSLAARILQLKCRETAVVRGVLPRDRTAFILQCMEEE